MTIVGFTPLNAAELDARIVVEGRGPIDEVRTFFERVDFFCMPKRLEPFEIVSIEAMACGIPIVSPRVVALPD